MNELPLIALVGAKRSGKDETAKILVRDHGYRRQAFADPLKREIYLAFGRYLPGIRSFEDFMLWLDITKKHGPWEQYGWVRPLLQFWRTEYRRQKCAQDYWIDKIDLAPGVVVTDARFTNELQAVKDRGGYVVRVYRDEADRESEKDPHASEQEWRSWEPDFMLYNDGPLEALPLEVERIMVYVRATHWGLMRRSA